MPRSTLMCFLAALGCFVGSEEVDGAGAELPHILFILQDDVGWDNVDWHNRGNGNVFNSTPHLHGLLREGIELTRHYAFKLCSPSRSAIQSGRNPIHCTVRNDDVVLPGAGMAENMTGIAEVMQRAGYDTHFVGKWDAGMATPRHTPQGRGYNSSLAYFHHCVDYWTLTPSIGCPIPSAEPPHEVKMVPIVDLWDGDVPSFQNGSSACGTVRDVLTACDCTSCDRCTNASDLATGVGRIVYGPFEGDSYVDDLFADRVVSLIETHFRRSDHLDHSGLYASPPLFIFWAPHTAHSPLQVPAKSLAKIPTSPTFAHESKKVYSAMMFHIDGHVGRIKQALEVAGVWNNTLIVWTSDNGGPVYNNGTPGASNFPLRGGKMSNWDGGIRVPAFVSGGFVPASYRGSKSNILSAVWDWYATFAGLIGVDPTDTRAENYGLPPIDSIDLSKALGLRFAGKAIPSTLHDTSEPRDEISIGTDLINVSGFGSTRVQGLIMQKWKLLVGPVSMAGWQGPIFPNMSTNWLGQNDILDCGSMGCLFDLDRDPEERDNLVATFPEIADIMRERILQLNAAVYNPDRGVDDGSACRAALARGQVWGPFLP
eukprot:INCI1106.2.p1 GENE.INCI1106.2~~INCI1106.2.p1  ORF type:complete len:597 (+),score=61.47 INCI1106.2:143-1933(+)